MSDLTELFSRDPLKLSQDDVRAIVTAYREKRRQYNLGGTLAGKVKAAPAKSLALANAVKSDDLDI